MPTAPRVFLSYSHDSADHRQRVLVLAERLREGGLDTTVDQYLEPAGPAEGWPRWMDGQLRTADFVLAVCTAAYRARVEGREQAGVGHGVAWEGKLIYQHIYNAAAQNTKFLPVLLGDSSREDIPVPLQDVPDFRPESEEGYRALYRRLTGQGAVEKRELGTVRADPASKVALPALRSGAVALRGRKALLVSGAALAAALGGLWFWNRPPAEFTVQVSAVDASGAPVTNAKVFSMPEGVQIKSEGGWRITVPAASVPEGKLLLRVIAADLFQLGEQELELGRSANVRASIRLHAMPQARVAGTVRDAKMRAVAGARVSISGSNDFVLTGANGGFDLAAHVAQGQQVRLNVEKAGYAPVQQDHLAGGFPAEIVLDR